MTLTTTSSVTDPVRVEVIADPRDLTALRADWNNLFERYGHEPSGSYEWTTAMMTHHVRRGDRLFVIRGSRGGTTVALLPLVLRQLHILRQRIVLLAPLSDEYNTHSDWLLGEQTAEVADSLVEGLTRIDTWDIFRMSRILQDNPRTSQLREALGRRGLAHHVRRGDASYFLELPDTYEGYLAARSSKFRNFLKRLERRVEATGAVNVRLLADAAEFDTAYERMLDVERASWKQSHGTAITAVPRQVGFYRDMCRGALTAGHLHLQWLDLGDQPLAYNLGYIKDDWYYYLKTSFDERHKAISPATYLRARLIEHLIERGIRHFDFPGAPYEWERQWTDTVRRHTVLTVYSGTLPSRALQFIERLRHWKERNDVVDHLDPRSQKAPRAEHLAP